MSVPSRVFSPLQPRRQRHHQQAQEGRDRRRLPRPVPDSAAAVQAEAVWLGAVEQ